MPLHVVQWTTGIVGRAALRAIIAHPELELVGVYCHGEEKVGQDAGTLASIDPVGVIATNSLAAVIALQPDCVVYMPQWPNIDELEQLLSAGINVVTTARLVTGKYYKNNAGARLEKAAQAGGASLFGTGMHPLFIPTLALASTAMCGTVKKISMLESLDCVMYEGAETWKAYGFGQSLDHGKMKQDLWDAEPDYRELLDVVATSLGVSLDDMTLDVDYALADADRDLGYLQIPKGTVAALDATWRGLVGGSVFVEVRTVWKLGGIYGHTETPNWDLLYGYKINVEGDMNINLKFSFVPEDIKNIDIGITTALPAVNAIAQVCAAPSGVVTPVDLTLMTSRGVPA